MSETLICVMCPIGCELVVTALAADLAITGNLCDKGIDFARDEILEPIRNIATSIPIAGTDFRMLSVRLSKGIPRKLIPAVMSKITEFRTVPPVRRGDILIRNVASSGADLIATRTVE